MAKDEQEPEGLREVSIKQIEANPALKEMIQKRLEARIKLHQAEVETVQADLELLRAGYFEDRGMMW
jgi:hypothetical protein